MINADNQRLWFSRFSFGLSAVAFTAMLFGGCQDGPAPALHEVPAIEQARVSPRTGAETEKKTPSQAEQPAPDEEVAKQEKSPGEQSKSTKSVAPNPGVDVQKELLVKRLVVTPEVKDREPLPASDWTVGEGPVVAFVELANRTTVDQKIEITFEHEDGKQVGFVKLEVPAEQSRWRTWGQTRNIKRAGKWTAVVRSEDGTELDRTEFEVNPT